MNKYKNAVFILAAAMSLTACGMDGREVTETKQAEEPELTDVEERLPAEQSTTEQNQPPIQEADLTVAEKDVTEEKVFTLTDQGKDFLTDLCLYLPDFTDTDSLEESFWQDFLFCSYTDPYREDVEFVEVWREGLGFDEPEAKVPKEQFVSYVKLTLGVDMPDYEPAFEEMEATQTGCYYQDGYYYVGSSDFPAFSFEFTECRPVENGRYEAEFAVELETEPDGNIVFTLEPADNENGFIVVGRKRNL